MELPLHLKELYRHWNFHVVFSNNVKSVEGVFNDKILFEEISSFIKERISIWKKKTSGDMPPYTQDEILLTYRFCNIFREFDRQTIEFHELLNPLRDNFSLWLLNMFYFRLVARTETVKEVGLLSFDIQKNKLFYKRFMKSNRPRFGTPYVFPVSVIMKSKTPTRELFIANYLPSIMDSLATEILTWDKKTVYDGVQIMTSLFGYNLNFLWTEVLIDVAYQFPQYIDLFGRFPIGPGSMPTMNRIDFKKDPSLLVEELSGLVFNTDITFNNKPLQLSAENWEGIGCEFRKYSNLKQGKGRKRIFRKLAVIKSKIIK